MTAPRYTFEVTAYYNDSRVLEQVERGRLEMNEKAGEILNGFNAALDRAALALMADGAVGLYQARAPEGSVSLCVGDMPAVGEHINNIACTVSVEWDGWIANVVTTWFPPYEHLNA